MPLTLLVKRLPDVPARVIEHADALHFRNTTLVYLNIDHPNLFPDNWIYVHDPTLQLGRITNFRNWSAQLHGEETTSILALEYWSYDDEPLWHATDRTLIELASDEITKTGLIQQARILGGQVVRIRRCYPVYDRNYKDHLKPIEAYLSEIKNLTVIGRYGAFKYNNQDHSILMGILAAERIADDIDHSLWEINTNYETYQEAALITETGLVEAGANREF
jgi:protoporphyrinogen oxidase